MAIKFRDAFLQALETTGWTVAHVAAASGVSLDQLRKVKQGKSQSTNVDDARLVAAAFGVTLDEFLQDDSAHLRSEAADLWRQLTQGERDLLLAAARGQRVDRDPSHE